LVTSTLTRMVMNAQHTVQIEIYTVYNFIKLFSLPPIADVLVFSMNWDGNRPRKPTCPTTLPSHMLMPGIEPGLLW